MYNSFKNCITPDTHIFEKKIFGVHKNYMLSLNYTTNYNYNFIQVQIQFLRLLLYVLSHLWQSYR